jgi:hypothetical protein
MSAQTETVERPPPGTLARGAFEAPAWAFYLVLVIVLLAAASYAYVRVRKGRSSVTKRR